MSATKLHTHTKQQAKKSIINIFQLHQFYEKKKKRNKETKTQLLTSERWNFLRCPHPGEGEGGGREKSGSI
jgi:hypothetical protein